MCKPQDKQGITKFFIYWGIFLVEISRMRYVELGEEA
jgi:hypothetical protein